MEEGALEKCVQNEGITVEFMEICKWLTDEIQVLTGIIEKITGNRMLRVSNKGLFSKKWLDNFNFWTKKASILVLDLHN
jgi:hypothetical protein